MVAGLVHGSGGPLCSLLPQPALLALLSLMLSPNTHKLHASQPGTGCTLHDATFDALGNSCGFGSEKNVIIFFRPQPATKVFRSTKPQPLLISLLVPIHSGLWGPRSLTMAFSRRFLARQTLGVPSEHGPLLSHLSVNKQSRGSHSGEGPQWGR